MKKVSIWGNFCKLKEELEVGEILNRFKMGTYGHIIRPLRRMYRDGNKAGYDLLKKTLDAVTFCATFLRIRRVDRATGYTGIIILDIDKLSEERLASVRPIIERCEFTLACFLSPSGQGLKVLVMVSTGIEHHLQAFNSSADYYEKITGVEIDKSGKDITRLCFVTLDPALYYNQGATIFRPGEEYRLRSNAEVVDDEDDSNVGRPLVGLPDSEEGWPQGPSLHYPQPVNHPPQAENHPPQPENHPPQDKKEPIKAVSDVFKTYRKCIARTERYHTFTEGHRNEFVFTAALLCSRAGIDKEIALQLLLKDYNFSEHEVRICVKSAYSYAGTEKAAAKRGYGDAPQQPVAKPGFEAMLDPTEYHTVESDIPSPDAANANPPQLVNRPSRTKYEIKKVEEILRLLYDTRLNEVTGMVELKEKGSRKQYKRLEDPEENTLLRLLYHNKQKIPPSILHAILYSDFSPRFHPFRSYFKGIQPWDMQIDYIGQLADTLTTTNNEYFRFCFRKWFVAFAMSLIVDNIINHTVIVLVGRQGLGKTQWVKKLMPSSLSAYVGNAAIHADSKDTAIMLSNCGLITMDDFDSLSRKDLAQFKEIITRIDIYVRKPYGHNAELLVRRASFVAAVNHDKILTDLTGSRRFLCFMVNKIDYLHEVDIDRCMAQAYALYMTGFQFWFDKEEISDLSVHNEDFMSKSVMEELIIAWIRKVSRAEWDNRDNIANGQSIRTMSCTQIALFLMEKARFILSDAITNQIGKIMNKMGFEYVKRKGNHLYILRIVDAESVEKASYPPVNTDAQHKETDDIQQNINYDEDTAGDELPF